MAVSAANSHVRPEVPPRLWALSWLAIRPAREALFWLLAVAVLLWQGWQRGVNLVALIAFFLLAVWLLNFVLVMFRFSLRKLRLVRQVESPVFAGTPFSVTYALENPTGRDQRALRVSEQERQARWNWFVPLLRRGETERRRELVAVPRRGRYLWPRLRLCTAYPFGLFSRTLRQATRDSTIVLPRLGRLHVGRLRRLLRHQPHLAHGTQRPRRRHPVSQTDFYGLREFRPGDSPRWIHWRTTARIGELMVREFEEPPLDDLTVIVEPWLPEDGRTLQSKLDQVRRSNQALISRLLVSGEPPPDIRRSKEAALAKKEEPFRVPLDNLERALSLAATILWLWHRQPGAELALAFADQRLGLFIGDNSASLVETMLESLAQVEGGPKADVDALIGQLSEYSLPQGPVILLTTHATPLADRLATALGRHVAVVDASLPACHEMFEVGD
jgi:uncharacterized protein (DUF58 family)